jgi:hypothetical protein
MGSQRLTAWAMARPCQSGCQAICFCWYVQCVHSSFPGTYTVVCYSFWHVEVCLAHWSVDQSGPNQYETNLLPQDVRNSSYLIQTINSLANGLLVIITSFDMIITIHLCSPKGNNRLTRPTVQQIHNHTLPPSIHVNLSSVQQAELWAGHGVAMGSHLSFVISMYLYLYSRLYYQQNLQPYTIKAGLHSAT